MNTEPRRDPQLGEALRATAPTAAAERVERDDLLVTRIVQAARPRLLRLGAGRRAWWEWTAAWARVALPVGVAASFAAGALLLTAEPASDSPAVGESALVFAEGTRGTELAAELVPPVTDEWLFDQVYDR